MIADYSKFYEKIKDKSVLVVGGAPSAKLVTKEVQKTTDIVIRCNTFVTPEENDRVDIWFAHFGRSIRNEGRRERAGMYVCKWPDNPEFGWVYEYRKNFWPNNKVCCVPTEQESFQTNNPFNFSPTCGLCAIIASLQGNPKSVTIAGFDFFESHIHNLNEPWDGSGGHIPQFEKRLVEAMHEQGMIKWIK